MSQKWVNSGEHSGGRPPLQETLSSAEWPEAGKEEALWLIGLYGRPREVDEVRIELTNNHINSQYGRDSRQGQIALSLKGQLAVAHYPKDIRGIIPYSRSANLQPLNPQQLIISRGRQLNPKPTIIYSMLPGSERSNELSLRSFMFQPAEDDARYWQTSISSNSGGYTLSNDSFYKDVFHALREVKNAF